MQIYLLSDKKLETRNVNKREVVNWIICLNNRPV